MKENVESIETVAVIGLGYVGLPLLKLMNDVGLKTLGIDIDKERIEKLKLGQSYIDGISDDNLKSLNTEFNIGYDQISSADVILICVPTPLNKAGLPDLSPLKSVIDGIIPHITTDQLICLESTTYPGCTYEMITSQLSQRGFSPGEDINIAFSPEREDPGNGFYKTNNIPKLVGGATPNCAKRAESFYKQFIEKVKVVSSCEVAELAKLLENSFRLVNISLVNEIKKFADELQIDMNEVVNAAATKPFGFMPFYPSAGAGGHCIPVDPIYLTWKSEQYNIKQTLITSAFKVNNEAPIHLVAKILDIFKKNNLKSKKVLLLGMTYKKNIRDVRNSASVSVLKALIQNGVDVHFYDPHVESLTIEGNLKYGLKSEIELMEKITEFDLTVILTDHDGLDYKKIETLSNLIFDTKKRLSKND